jgi:exosome complex RNA-binding protein Rrp42 (RNase PH superfamily)
MVYFVTLHRPDGRSLSSARTTTFSASQTNSSSSTTNSSSSSSSPFTAATTNSVLNTANACSFVSLGHTQVLAGITLQVGKPTEQLPTDGWFCK